MKKILKIYLILNLISWNLFANNITSDQENLVVCEEPSIEEFFPVGDTRGNLVLTKREETRTCTITKTVLGDCKVWEEDKVLAGLPTEAYDSYRTADFGNTVGEVMAALGAYDQLLHLWSGFKGYCIDGTLQDYGWAEDPLFWGTLMLSYFMDSGALDGAAQSTGEVLTQTTVKTAEEVATDMTFEVAKYTAKELTNIGKCVIAAGVNLGTALAEGLEGLNGGPIDCDPIDEICEDETGDQGEGQVQTMDKVAFDDYRDQWIESSDGTEPITFDEMVEIIDDGSTDGVVTYRMHPPAAAKVEGMDSSEMDDMAREFQKLMLTIKLASVGAGLAACAMGAGGSISQAGGGGDDKYVNENKEMAKTAASSAISIGSKFAGPAGPFINMAGQILLELATSFDSVDTCKDEDDAGQMGSRHSATQKSLKFNLCRPLYDECEEKWAWGGCSLRGYHHCCYDQILTKVLVTQMMAQLGRDWAHCAGITVSDLNHVSFAQCSDAQRSNGIDGATQYGRACSVNFPVSPCWEPTDAYQYKHKCMDLTEFKEYLASQMSDDMDMDGFDEYWNDLTIPDAY